MPKMRAKDKIFFGYTMGKVNNHIAEEIKVQPLEEAKERNTIMQEINKIAFENNYLQKDDKVINLTSMPIHLKGMVNTVRVSKI